MNSPPRPLQLAEEASDLKEGVENHRDPAGTTSTPTGNRRAPPLPEESIEGNPLVLDGTIARIAHIDRHEMRVDELLQQRMSLGRIEDRTPEV